MGISMVVEKCNMLADQVALDYLGNQDAPPAGSAGEKLTESGACWCCGGREVVRSGGQRSHRGGGHLWNKD